MPTSFAFGTGAVVGMFLATGALWLLLCQFGVDVGLNHPIFVRLRGLVKRRFVLVLRA